MREVRGDFGTVCETVTVFIRTSDKKNGREQHNS